MHNIQIIEASNNFKDVASLVKDLLIELSPSAKEKLESTEIESIAKRLLESSKIWAYLAKHNDKNIGVITLHECAAIYAGGVFASARRLAFSDYVEEDARRLESGADGRQLAYWQNVLEGVQGVYSFPTDFLARKV